MSRKAILIESSQLEDQPTLAGAIADVDNYARFLEGTAGGAWFGNEIVKLRNPSRRQVISELAKARNVDYALVTFSGHGYHVIGQDIEETRVCLNDREEMAVGELDSGNDRSFVIVDSCRGITVIEAMEKVAYSLRAFEVASDYVSKIRAVFDASVSQCERGRIIAYSCDLDEAASESRSGGFFSLSLIKCAEAWAKGGLPPNGVVLSSYQAFQYAALATTNRNRTQHPKYEGGRRLRHFPFGVRLSLS